MQNISYFLRLCSQTLQLNSMKFSYKYCTVYLFRGKIDKKKMHALFGSSKYVCCQLLSFLQMIMILIIPNQGCQFSAMLV